MTGANHPAVIRCATRAGSFTLARPIQERTDAAWPEEELDVARFEDDEEARYAAGRVPGRFYVSKRFPSDAPAGHGQRFAYEVHDAVTDEVVFESDQGWEVVLRETESRQQLKALFWEVDRGLGNLAFQRFNKDGTPIASAKTLLLDSAALARLQEFLAKIPVVELAGEGPGRFSPSAIAQLLAGSTIPAELLRDRREDVAEFLRSDLSAPEVLAVARRRAALDEFRSRLAQDHDEPSWQAWFEQEPWILGLGVAPQFLHSVGDKLEQVVGGHDLTGAGVRTDGLLQTAAQLSALAFVEIKRPDADLVRATPYRPSAFAPGVDVVGGVAQLHSATDTARRRMGERLALRDADGYEAEAVELCRPRSVLVVGQLSSLLNEDGQPHRQKFRSFESFRRSLREPEVLTFDELLGRAEAALALADG